MSTMRPDPDFQRLQEIDSRICRMGDGLLWGWGELKRAGLLDALLIASISSIREDGTIGAPGTHSDPTLSRLLEAENQAASTALLVDREVTHWDAMPETHLWADVARTFYAAPYRRENDEVAKMLRVSKRAVVQARSEMRRMIVITVEASRSA